MLEIFSYWQVNLSLAVVFMVLFNQFYRLTARKANDSASMMIIIFLIMCSTFLIFVPFTQIQFPSGWEIYGLFLITIIFYTINDRIKALGFKHLDVAIVSVLTQLSKVFLMLYGIFLLKEPLGVINIFGAFLIIGGSLLVVIKKDKFVFNKYVALLVIAAFVFATALFIDIRISQHFNLGMYLLMSFLLPAIIVASAERRGIASLKKEFNYNKVGRKYYFITGVTFALAVYFNLIALRQGQVSIVAPISSVTVLLNVFAGYIFLKEKDDLTKRIIAAILVIVGIFLLV